MGGEPNREGQHILFHGSAHPAGWTSRGSAANFANVDNNDFITRARMRKHILLIDDEEDIREVTAISLEMVAGWQVSSASSGLAGVELAKKVLPDAILLDVMMPDQDGPETLRLLRSDQSTARIPVIFLTAKVQSIERERLQAIGATATLAKPFDPITLAARMSEILGW